MSADLTAAMESGSRREAWAAVGDLLSSLSDPMRALDAAAISGLVLRLMARRRWFDMAEVLASAAASRSDATLGLRRLHAQMLMERGFYSEALERLERLRDHAQLDRFDRGELYGHLGRIYKDRFLDASAAGDQAAARALLQRAVESYLTLFPEERPELYWHGINAVALLSRREAREVFPDARERARHLAAIVMERVAAKDPALTRQYSPATMAEACLANRDYGKAMEWIRRAATSTEENAFSLASTMRQFHRVWELEAPGSEGAGIVALLRSAVMEREGSSLQMSGEEVRAANKAAGAMDLQAVFGADRFDSYENYRRGLDRCASVARIGRSVETGNGTGFVVPGKLLSAKLGGGFLLVTNAHVVSADEALRAEGALHPDEAIVTFAALEGAANREFTLRRILFSSPPAELDVVVAELSDEVNPASAYPLAPVLPARNTEATLRVIGHPSGRGLSLSSNRFLDHEAPKLHYRTATEGGSSGSPVFTHDWRLVALHHAGGEAVPKLNGQPGAYQANEGIWMRSICAAVEKSLT